MKHVRVLLLATMLSALPSIGAQQASATTAAKKLLFFQGNMTSWVNAAGVDEVASRLAAADIVALSHVGAHTYGGSEWPNVPYGAQGCIELDHRAAVISVLDKVRQIDASVGVRTLIFGYVAGTADAPDEAGKSALCGNNVNNFETPWYGTDTMTDFTACPAGGVCSNTVYWIEEWVDARDTLYWYIDGIFFDYVNSEKMTPSIRDNIYSYVKTKQNPITNQTLRIMANSTVPGSPCGGAAVCAPYGEVNNYEFAADSAYMTNDDYVLVEGYYAGGITGNCAVTESYLWYDEWCTNRDGVATLRIDDTNDIAAVRDTVAQRRGGVRVRLAALVTEPPDAAYSSLSCSWSNYTNAKSIFDASFVAGDAIGYQFSDLGTIDDDPLDGLPDRDVRACP